MYHHKIITGDSRNMNLIADQSVQLIVTSPPYWQLKDYGTASQIGFHDSYQEYINNLNLVWKECFRILQDGCRLCINIGDQFARAVYYGRYKVIPIRSEIIRFCEALGMDYMGAVIWQKSTTMNTTGGGAVMGSFPYPRNGILKIDYEFILLFKKLGKAPTPTTEQKLLSEMSKEEWDLFFASHWNFNGAKQDGHIAVFPEELPRRLIKMFSFVGETIFDPFLGSGTTTLAARNLNRNSIGYEINPSYLPMIKQKLQIEQTMLFDHEYEFLNDPQKKEIDYSILPYIYQDPHALDKRIDVKKLSFGSRMDQGNIIRNEQLHSIKKVIDPETLQLDNGLLVKLIGIRKKPNEEKHAIEFLNSKMAKHKVFLRFDEKKFDHLQRLLCYVYLDNRTFINLHLLRTGSVELDDSIDHRYKRKFQEAIKHA